MTRTRKLPFSIVILAGVFVISFGTGRSQTAYQTEWSGYKVGSNVLAPLSLDLQKSTVQNQSMGMTLQILPINFNVLTMDVFLWEQSRGYQSRTFNGSVYYRFPFTPSGGFYRFFSPYLKFNHLSAFRSESTDLSSDYIDIYRLGTGVTLGYGKMHDGRFSEFFAGLGYYFLIRETQKYILPTLIKPARIDLRIGLSYGLIHNN